MLWEVWIWEHHRVPGGTIIYTQLGGCQSLLYGDDDVIVVIVIVIDIDIVVGIVIVIIIAIVISDYLHTAGWLPELHGDDDGDDGDHDDGGNG